MTGIHLKGLQELHYQIYTSKIGHKGYCIEFPELTMPEARGKTDALWMAQEEVFKHLINNGFQFGIASAFF
ncbi:MAG: hypothetical protein AB8B89_06885 [Gammaproteobacteria bacterium]